MVYPSLLFLDEQKRPTRLVSDAVYKLNPETWYRYVGLDGKVVGLTTFGLSAPGNQVMERLGINAKSVVEAAKSLA